MRREHTDINTRTAWYSPTVRGGTTEGGASGFLEALRNRGSWGGAPIRFPRIQGADIVGRVVAVGAGVDEGRIGDRVIVDPWLRDPDHPHDRSLATFVGSERDGGFADYVCVPARNAHVVPSNWSDAELATLPCAYVTAENMLCRARVSSEDAVLVTGASGGVGSALVTIQVAG
ncbi:MAG: alcohol dehydrogenase catalytic domain-containing protein [Solirubrobacteraceae bacterium]